MCLCLILAFGVEKGGKFRRHNFQLIAAVDGAPSSSSVLLVVFFLMAMATVGDGADLMRAPDDANLGDDAVVSDEGKDGQGQSYRLCVVWWFLIELCL